MPVWDRRWPAHLNLLNLTKELLQVHRLGQERRHERLGLAQLIGFDLRESMDTRVPSPSA